MKERDQFDSLSPLDYRYWDEEVAKDLSENGFTRYKLCMELALVRVLHRRGICPEVVVREVETACGQVTTAEVYAEEDRIRHDIRAFVNCIRAKVSESAKPYVHMTATSYDIIDSANAARYRDVVVKVLVPSLTKLEGVLIGITLREAETVQVGRTHGQHAVPITFGFALAGYVSRLGGSIEALKVLAVELPGKFSGAVGAYNASSLFFDDPESFEAEVLAELRLAPAEHSTQIVPPEALTRLFCEVTITAGILANLSDDMRNLQRTEIGEVGEEFEAAQVGSSTMPQKRNPINFENSKSFWKIVMPRIMTVFMDQISEHQRDLTNSASARTYGEVIAYVVSTAKRLTRTMRTLTVDHENLKRNLNASKSGIAEPLQLMLSALGHPDAYEEVRKLTLQAQRMRRPLEEVVAGNAEMQGYLARMTPRQRQILSNPSLYTGIAAKKARAVAERWRERLNLQHGKEG
ncbi:MAG: adenylosuccinate lyase [Parcubacteria group bacterium Gr01-1014_38]|nr:MAG: adenylosuccinate lyase [Parcubacteria group bacterium Gr01-1014_38]